MRKGPAARFLDGIVPTWVPRSAVHYLAHTEAGLPIRKLARDAGCHASTVLRQIRSFETRREDPLVDSALCRLGRVVPALGNGSSHKETRMPAQNMTSEPTEVLTEDDLQNKGRIVLWQLSQPGTLLVVAAHMDKAVVVRDKDGGEPTRTDVIDKELAEAIALKGWIQCTRNGRLARYTISPAGRDALGRLMAKAENAASGFSDMTSAFDRKSKVVALEIDGNAPGARKRKRYAGTESPVLVLARRKTPDGEPFLSDEMVRAGDRLREDFELAQMEDRGAQNWDQYLTDAIDPALNQKDELTKSGQQARDRVAAALRDLGPGLGDVALLCCCYLEGLELAEKRMGWSARSGKVVLRIALQRLRRHYAAQGDAGQMMG